MLGRYNLFNIPLYSQIDPKWRNARLGFSPNLTIGSHGCVVCNVAMILASIGYSVDPLAVNESLKKIEAFLAGTGRMIWARVTNAYPLLKYGYQVFYDKRVADERFVGSLTDSLPVMLELVLPNRDIHWVLATRRDAKGILIHDPLLHPAQQRADYLRVLRPGSRIRRVVVYSHGD